MDEGEKKHAKSFITYKLRRLLQSALAEFGLEVALVFEFCDSSASTCVSFQLKYTASWSRMKQTDTNSTKPDINRGNMPPVLESVMCLRSKTRSLQGAVTALIVTHSPLDPTHFVFEKKVFISS